MYGSVNTAGSSTVFSISSTSGSTSRIRSVSLNCSLCPLMPLTGLVSGEDVRGRDDERVAFLARGVALVAEIRLRRGRCCPCRCAGPSSTFRSGSSRARA